MSRNLVSVSHYFIRMVDNLTNKIINFRINASLNLCGAQISKRGNYSSKLVKILPIKHYLNPHLDHV